MMSRPISDEEAINMTALEKENDYTLEDIEDLPNDLRAELIDGKIYYFATPKIIHQKLSGELFLALKNFINSSNGNCEVLYSPVSVYLNEDDKTYLEPDIIVVCDKTKLTDLGCEGAPDMVIEIVSPSTSSRDYGVKLLKYRTAKVREYWIVNPKTSTILVYDFEDEENTEQYTFDEEVPVHILKGLTVRLSRLLSADG